MNKKSRVKALGEVFTPPELVSQMLDKLSSECWEPHKTFLEPSCGTGNFCVAVLQRKLDAGHPPLQALSTIFGIDIMEDNVEECRRRMLEMAVGWGADENDARSTCQRNIICGDALAADWLGETWPPSFCNATSQNTSQKRKITEKKVNSVSPPKKSATESPPMQITASRHENKIFNCVLSLAQDHTPDVHLNVKSGYTALSWKGRNVCFAFNGRHDNLIFKLPQQRVIDIFSPVGFSVTMVKDGKHTWPAVKVQDVESNSWKEAMNAALVELISGEK